MNKTAKKALVITGIVLGSIIGLFLLLYAVLAIIGACMYGEARNLREYVCIIPETNSGFAPQGVTYSAEKDVYIQTGYDGDNNVMLYIVNGKSARRVKLLDEDGNVLKGHAGGVTCTKDKVYIANDANLVMFDLNELVDAGDAEIEPLATIPVDNNAAYCYSDDDHLYVGEFYRAGNYETDEHHHYTTPNGDENKAIISCYRLKSDGSLLSVGGKSYPLYCISVTGLVQGCALKDGVLVLSRSYGLKNSKLEYHKISTDLDLSTELIDVKFKHDPDALPAKVALFYADSTTLVKSLTLPAFSEDITIVNDRVIVTNEASANKYFVGKLFGANKVYSYPMYGLEQ